MEWQRGLDEYGQYLKEKGSKKGSYFPFPSDGQFGHVSDSTWVVNQGIDTPLVCVEPNDRPM